jgi:uncharacterized protein YlxW (UPF0749 family)
MSLSPTFTGTERRLVMKLGWFLLILVAIPLITLLGQKVWADSISQKAHAPTVVAAKEYTDAALEKQTQKLAADLAAHVERVNNLGNDVQSMAETIQWMAGVMEGQTGIQRPAKLRGKR